MTKKGQFLQALQEAFANSDTDFITEHITNDIQWVIVGDRSIQGKEAFIEALEEMKSDVPMELSIDHIITHGRMASVNGTMAVPNAVGKTYAFCDVYRLSGFKKPKIKEMISYVIDVEA